MANKKGGVFVEKIMSRLLGKYRKTTVPMQPEEPHGEVDDLLEDSLEVVDAEPAFNLATVEPGDLPISILIGYIPGAKRKDADSYVRGLMLKFCNDLEASGYMLQRFRGGYAYEIQEGSQGKSWLKSVLRELEERRRLIVPAGNRYIRLDLDESGMHCLMLRDGDPEMAQAYLPAAGQALNPYHNYVQRWVVTASTLAIFSVFALVLSIYTQKLLTENEAEKVVLETISKTQTLPILYWPEVFQEDTYVAKIEFKNGRWSEPVFKKLNIEEVYEDDLDENGLPMPSRSFEEVVGEDMPAAEYSPVSVNPDTDNNLRPGAARATN